MLLTRKKQEAIQSLFHMCLLMTQQSANINHITSIRMIILIMLLHKVKERRATGFLKRIILCFSQASEENLLSVDVTVTSTDNRFSLDEERKCWLVRPTYMVGMLQIVESFDLLLFFY